MFGGNSHRKVFQLLVARCSMPAIALQKYQRNHNPSTFITVYEGVVGNNSPAEGRRLFRQSLIQLLLENDLSLGSNCGFESPPIARAMRTAAGVNNLHMD